MPPNPKKPIPKKKSASSSPGKKTPRKLPLFDTTAGALVGEVIKTDRDFIHLRWRAVFAQRPEPVNGGEAYQIVVGLQVPSPLKEIYQLSRQAVRGVTWMDEPWFLALYDQYVAQAKSGDYTLNIYTPPLASATLVQGTGSASAPESVGGTIQAAQEAASDG